ncbi:MAG: glycosyltransferase family 2 protein [Prochlorococcus marinus CUG1439]|uniref:glycosyltransferase family 2 protein n=1 Tax=Prochlorococcus sp. MIT 1314 TaxID=3096220 RepID=UPI001B23A211|nr:glycosyltransferase [Prochlorococcus sp. MIT 1314]MCR8538766.1 glycosyltransferase family 2 protein [Prochlorococcus marinus CUG1439]
MQDELRSKVAIIIPCYRAKNKVGILCKQLIKIASELSNICIISVYIVDDFCPENSYKEIPHSEIFNVIHNIKNVGVGASSLIGFKEALKSENQFFIKMDSDGQHPPEYLLELIPYLLNLPLNELILVKGTRFHFPINNINIPFVRRLGSFLLEPLSRMSLIYKGLTDISNGFISINQITLKYLISKKFKTKLESRYLFECSIIKSCSNFGANIHQFPMHTIYGKEWKSSMKSSSMIYPLLKFWGLNLLRDILYKYIYKLSLGSFFLLSSIISFLTSLYFLFLHILPKINSNILVTAGNASIFSANLVISIFLFSLFILYDYSKKKNVKIVFFKKFAE